MSPKISSRWPGESASDQSMRSWKEIARELAGEKSSSRRQELAEELNHAMAEAKDNGSAMFEKTQFVSSNELPFESPDSSTKS